MTPRKRLSVALRKATAAARADMAAQDELHTAFEAVYGFDLDIEQLGNDEWVDALVYGTSGTPSLSAVDKAVDEFNKSLLEE